MDAVDTIRDSCWANSNTNRALQAMLQAVHEQYYAATVYKEQTQQCVCGVICMCLSSLRTWAYTRTRLYNMRHAQYRRVYHNYCTVYVANCIMIEKTAESVTSHRTPTRTRATTCDPVTLTRDACEWRVATARVAARHTQLYTHTTANAYSHLLRVECITARARTATIDTDEAQSHAQHHTTHPRHVKKHM